MLPSNWADPVTMKMAKVSLAWALWSAPLAITSGCMQQTKGCAIGACTSGAVLNLAVPVPPSSSAAQRMTVCLNAKCGSGDLPRIDAALEPALFSSDQQLDDVTRLFWYVEDLGSSMKLTVQWQTSESPPRLYDGDHYTLEVDDKGTGAVTARMDWIATYQTTHANGLDCPPPPCRTAILGE